jgi:hypothetical protein
MVEQAFYDEEILPLSADADEVMAGLGGGSGLDLSFDDED